ncbi:MAG: lipopolysaccharide heptosyltransferase family protein [Cyanobacteria bacterium K_DeepCast_35m_m2_155]|nr:lipopolysaccharide heptosyltransferase family protein [Cyanobacteria bacterium K_DeepCast_35m_m2_155]
MRALFLIPGDAVRQLQAMPAVAAVAQQLSAQVQVVCSAAVAPCWSLLPAADKVIPFDFAAANLADWANLLGSVREPDFQLCINLAEGRQVDLMLSMSHIPTRVASGGFSATETVTPSLAGWPAQALEVYLKPIGVALAAGEARLSLPRSEVDAAAAALPQGEGPLLLLAPTGKPGDWPAQQWQQLPGLISQRLANLRAHTLSAAGGVSIRQRALLLAASDVVLASDPVTIELALLLGLPLVALGRPAASLPVRQGVQGLAEPGELANLEQARVLTALGFA